MDIKVLGGSWISGDGYGTLKSKINTASFNNEPVLPEYRELFKEPLSRYGRFDNYTKIGCSAAALALKDSNLHITNIKRPIGFIISSIYESYNTDIEYYKSTIENNGAFTSPNLFSYTLPGIVLGECSAYFKLSGPSLCIGENPDKGFGYSALKTSLLMLETGEADTIITGWLDYPPDICSGLKGAVFAVLSTNINLMCKSVIDSEKLNSLLDVFQYS